MLPGTQTIPATTRHYVLYEDGSAGLIETNSGDTPTLTKPGRTVSEEEYRSHLNGLVEQRAEYLAGLLAGDEERTRGDFEALTAAGIPDATARRMSGYQGGV